MRRAMIISATMVALQALLFAILVARKFV